MLVHLYCMESRRGFSMVKLGLRACLYTSNNYGLKLKQNSLITPPPFYTYRVSHVAEHHRNNSIMYLCREFFLDEKINFLFSRK